MPDSPVDHSLASEAAAAAGAGAGVGAGVGAGASAGSIPRSSYFFFLHFLFGSLIGASEASPLLV